MKTVTPENLQDIFNLIIVIIDKLKKTLAEDLANIDGKITLLENESSEKGDTLKEELTGLIYENETANRDEYSNLASQLLDLSNRIEAIKLALETSITDVISGASTNLEAVKSYFDIEVLKIYQIIKDIQAVKPVTIDTQKIIEDAVNLALTELTPLIPSIPSINEIRDQLEALQGDERLDKSAIKGLDNLIDKESLDRAISILDKRTQYLINKNTPSSSAILPLTTKGDLLGFSTVAARVPIGTSGQVLVVDLTQPLGLKWVTPTITIPGGSNTQVQFNDGGVFGGNSGLTYFKNNPQLKIGTGDDFSSNLNVTGNNSDAVVSIFQATGNGDVGLYISSNGSAFPFGGGKLSWNEIDDGLNISSDNLFFGTPGQMTFTSPNIGLGDNSGGTILLENNLLYPNGQVAIDVSNNLNWSDGTVLADNIDKNLHVRNALVMGVGNLAMQSGSITDSTNSNSGGQGQVLSAGAGNSTLWTSNNTIAASDRHTNLSASLASTSMYTPPTDGEYEMVISTAVTTVGTSGTITPSITYTDDVGATSQTGTAITVTSTAVRGNDRLIFHAKTTAAIKYAVTFAGTAGTLKYNVYANLIRLR